MVTAIHARINRDCTTRVKAAGRHSLPEELLELLLTEPERRPRLQATSNVLNPLFIAHRLKPASRDGEVPGN